MPHIYRVHTKTPGTIGDVVTYLQEHGFISKAFEITTNSVQIIVANKANFERYIKCKNRESTDPGGDIINVEYLDETGKAASSSKEGKLAIARLRALKKTHKTK